MKQEACPVLRQTSRTLNRPKFLSEVRMLLLQHPHCSSVHWDPTLIQLSLILCIGRDPKQSDHGTGGALNTIPTISHSNPNTGSSCICWSEAWEQQGHGQWWCAHIQGHMIYDQIQNLLFASCGNMGNLNFSIPQFPYLDLELMASTHKVAWVQ